MIAVLASGKLAAAPERRVSKTGRVFATARMLAATDDGPAWINLIAFDDAAVQALLQMDRGEVASISGTAKVAAYRDKAGEPKGSLDVVAGAVMTAWEAQKRRAAVPPAAAGAVDDPWSRGAP